MKKVSLLFITVFLLFSLTACGVENTSDNYGYIDIEEDNIVEKIISGYSYEIRVCDTSEKTWSRAESQSDENFEILNKFYAKNSDTVYRCDSFEGLHTREVKDVDALSFEIVDGYFARDKNAIYSKYRRYENSHPESFELIKDFKTSIWLKDKTMIYHFGNGDGMIGFNADLETFEVLGSHYAKDENSVFCMYQKVESVDLKTFHIKKENSSIAYDKNNVYSWGIILTGENPETYIE